MRAVLTSLLCAGCGFSLAPAAQDAPAGDGRVDAPDGTEIDAAVDAPIDAPAPLDLAHVGPADEAMLTSTVDYPLSGMVTINTETGMISPAVPNGVVVRSFGQENGGLALMVIQARRIDVQAGAQVQIRGTRGIVFVATEDIIVNGRLDASAARTTPGPGGYPSSNGPGGGADAAGSSGDETGGSGASFGTRGGNGGTCDNIPMTGPASPAVYGSATLGTLEGGSGGGNALASSAPGPCGAGGAGGGAIQLTAPMITIMGSVTANGGGGDGGRRCNTTGTNDASSGSGGGAGGSIYLQAYSLTGSGSVTANGGGGGGGGCVQCSNQSGTPGADGQPNAQPAAGGISPLTPRGDGGGGSTSGPGTIGGTGGNAGGGGGGGGRIFLAVPTSATVSLVSSPPATRP